MMLPKFVQLSKLELLERIANAYEHTLNTRHLYKDHTNENITCWCRLNNRTLCKITIVTGSLSNKLSDYDSNAQSSKGFRSL